MPRHALSPLVAGMLSLAALVSGELRANDPHLDRTLLPLGCSSCHAGHGMARSPMLDAPQVEVCLACHDSQTRLDEEVRRGRVAPDARPPLLGPTLDLPVVHPLSASAFSRHDPGEVTCSSCHSPHRRSTPLPGQAREGVPRLSTRDPSSLEHQLCESCHGEAGPTTLSPLDKSRLFDPSSRSSHPVQAPVAEGSPSVRAALRGQRISCTDCHGSSDAAGPRGVHASRHEGLLVEAYTRTDGSSRPLESYALCFKCHEPGALFERSPFPLHRLHVEQEHASCATCHSSHGSIDNRALIRFGEETRIAGVSPSASTGRLAFESDVAGSGACFLSCHGVDHAPATYGATAEVRSLRDALVSPAEPRRGGPAVEWPPGERAEEMRPKPPPPG